MSHGGPRQRKASGTNKWMETLCQGRYGVRGLIPHRAFKEETIAINRDWDNHTYRLPHDTHAISLNFVTLSILGLSPYLGCPTISYGISNNVVYATSKASDQPAHTRSLIRSFASRLNII